MSTKQLQILGSLTTQADWAQSDENSADYIKNKTHYRLPLTDYVKVENLVYGTIYFLQDLSSYSSYILSNYFSADNIWKNAADGIKVYRLSLYMNGGMINKLLEGYPTKDNVVLIDSTNYVINTSGLQFYVIIDTTTLTDEYIDKFTTIGIYCQANGNIQVREAGCQLFTYYTISDDYLPSTIARTSNLSTVATTGSYNDLIDKPDIATDEEIVVLLANNGFISPVVDSTETILTDSDGSVLLL